MGRGQTGRRGDERREPSVESEDRKDMDTEVTGGAARCGSCKVWVPLWGTGSRPQFRNEGCSYVALTPRLFTGAEGRG